MIIDIHSHLGHDVVFDEEQTEEQLISSYRAHDIDGAIVQPFVCRPYIEDVKQVHNRVYELCKCREKHFWGIVSINPHFRPEDYDREAERCIRDLGFVAIKITPIAHAVHPSSRDAMHVYEVARALNVPVMVHTGAGAPFADPISAVKAVESFRDVLFVLAHAGAEAFNQQAAYMAGKYENVYLEPSWVGVMALENMIRQLGYGKIMFSSDILPNVPVELAKYRSLIKSREDLERVFSRNAISLFKLNVK